MSSIKQLLEIRKRMKRKKPSFLAQDSHKKVSIRKRWTKPKGWHSKIRLGIKGYRKRVKVGYGSPSKVKFLDKTGLMPVLVYNVDQLLSINKETDIATIGGTVGLRKKKEMLLEAKKKDMLIRNVKDIDAELKRIDEFVNRNKKLKSQAMQKKEQKNKEIEEIAKKKEDEKTKGSKGAKDELTEKLEEEQKKIEEKKEMDKLLAKDKF